MAYQEVLGLITVVVFLSLYYIQSDETLMNWHGDTKVLLSKSGVPFINDTMLGVTRLLMGLFIWIVNLLTISESITIDIVVSGKDKPLSVKLNGYERFATFTLWNWTILGFYFILAAGFSFSKSFQSLAWIQKSDLLADIAIVIFEIGFSLSYLVSYCVTYLIIPGMKKRKVSLKHILSPKAIACHNANILFVAIDMVIGRNTISPWHFVFIILWTALYVLFAWIWNHYKGYFFYDFLDYNRKNTIWIHIGLLTFLTCLYFFGYFISVLKEQSRVTTFLVSSMSYS